jgi:pimeloyl-ACP methyl ester carboxylesterase
LIYFLHGWGGRGGQFFRFGPPLLAAGFSVVFIDAPAHGETPGKTATLREFSDSLVRAIEQCGPAYGIIAHSLGAAAATLALKEGLRAERTILLAPPESPGPYLEALVHKLGVDKKLLPALQDQVARRLRLTWKQVSLLDSPPQKSPVLIVGDKKDADVPISSVEAIAQAWPGAELMTTENWGHHRLLRAPEVITRTLAFLSASHEKPATA